MKLLLILIIAILNCLVNAQSNKYYANIVPYANSCSDSESYGIGYQLPFSQCIADYNLYLLLSNDNKFISAYWLNNCSLPLDFSGATKDTYAVGSCSKFKMPLQTSYLSSISLVVGDNANSIPNGAIVYSNYFQSSSECNGQTYTQFYTNGYSFIDANSDYNKYTCNNTTPSLYTCARSGECDTAELNNDCNEDWEHAFPYRVAC